MPTNLERRLLILRFLHVLEPFFFGSRDDIIRRCCVERRCSLVISFDVRSSCQSPGFRTCRCDHTRDCFALPPLSNVSFAAFSTMVPKRSKPSVMPRKIEPMLSLHLTQTYISSIYQPAPPPLLSPPEYNLDPCVSPTFFMAPAGNREDHSNLQRCTEQIVFYCPDH